LLQVTQSPKLLVFEYDQSRRIPNCVVNEVQDEVSNSQIATTLAYCLATLDFLGIILADTCANYFDSRSIFLKKLLKFGRANNYFIKNTLNNHYFSVRWGQQEVKQTCCGQCINWTSIRDNDFDKLVHVK